METTIICLENMGIGGVESAVINQALEYKREGKKIVIVAKEGIYSTFLREHEIEFENFEFPLENNFNIQKIQDFCNIIKKYNAKEVIINQFPCIMIAFPACFIKNIPYVIYLHTATKTIKNDEFNVFNWFENQYSIYKTTFKIFFENSKKIIAISNNAAEYVQSRYNINKDKFIVIPNSIDLEIYKTNKDNTLINNREKFVIISRITNEKIKSIKNGIDIFKGYKNQNKTLDIIGDGNKLEEIKEYISHDEKIKLLGAKDNISKLLDNYDIVLGLDRTILEALTMKKIAVVIGYDNPKEIITKENIQIAAKNGFSGEGLKDKTIDQLAKEIKEKEINVEENYKYIEKNLNIRKNIYTEKDYTSYYEYIKLFKIIEEIQKQNQELIEENKKIAEEKNKQIKEKNDELEKELNKVKNELESVYNSKRFKIINSIANVIKPNKSKR